MKRFLILLFALLPLSFFAACGSHEHPTSLTQSTPSLVGQPPETLSLMAVDTLNTKRLERGLTAVRYSQGLTDRCHEWAEHMERHHRMEHDRRVYGTDERENILWNTAPIDPVGAIFGWEASPPHADAMFDRRGFPTAVTAGYAQVGDYACLRLCPEVHDHKVCSDA